mmetsp:Transcript_23316/g.59406  ORF Transcript_23316/g.59406 Transcript_23316/m.59406 type:complete len:215 (-) Transcript_23316:68-712(-)
MSLASWFCALYKFNEKNGSRCQAISPMSGLNERRLYDARSRRNSCRARALAKPSTLSNSDSTSAFRATLAACNVSRCSHSSSLQTSRRTLASFRTSLSMLARLSTSAACRGCHGLCASTIALPLVGFIAWPGGLASFPGSPSALELGTFFLVLRLSGLKPFFVLRPLGLALHPLLGYTLQQQEGQRLAVLGQVPRPPAPRAHHRSTGHRNGGHD